MWADILLRIHRHEQFDPGAEQRPASEWLRHLEAQIGELHDHVESGRPQHDLLISIAAAAIRWATLLDERAAP